MESTLSEVLIRDIFYSPKDMPNKCFHIFLLNIEELEKISILSYLLGRIVFVTQM